MLHEVLPSRCRGGGVILAAALILLPAAAAAQNWPSFRGPQASGIAAGANPPVRWDAEQGVNVRWRTPIPGLGHSSPIIWGERIFLTTAVNTTDPDPYLRVGLYGESPDNPEEVVHHYRVYCLDKKTGKVLWATTVHRGKPQVKRHIKSTHANSSVATDGTHVVAHFGSEGLYGLDMEGKVRWKVDLGYLDAGAFDVPEIQWGYGSSPLIYEGKVIVLCDVRNQSFLALFDVRTGEEIWRTRRDEVPTWGTPAVHRGAERTQIIVNGYRHIGGYDLATGAELWRLRGGGDVPVPTPVVAHGLVFITNSHGRTRPIYAIRLNAEGDVSLAEGQTSNQFVAWSYPQRGAYLPTPLVYGDHLYVGTNNGVLTSYEARTGKQLYRTRIAGLRGAYSASPVAADGRIYFTDEYCEVHVVKAGAQYEHLASNPMDGVCLATPAITGDMIFVRSSKHLYGIGRSDRPLVYADAAPAPKKEVAATPEPKVLPKLPAGELTDPRQILERAQAVALGLDAIRYELVMVGTEAAQALFPGLKSKVTAAGSRDGLPEKYRFEVEAKVPQAPEPMRLIAGSDGDVYYLIDPRTKTVHEDLELRVIGSHVDLLFRSFIRELHRSQPYMEELGSENLELLASKEVHGEDCYALHFVLPGEPPSEGTWYFSKKDFLPRGIVFHFTLRDGARGGVEATLRNVVVDPELAPDFFDLKVPEGYTKTDASAP